MSRTQPDANQHNGLLGVIGGAVAGAAALFCMLQVATYVDDPALLEQYQKWGLCMVYGEWRRGLLARVQACSLTA